MLLLHFRLPIFLYAVTFFHARLPFLFFCALPVTFSMVDCHWRSRAKLIGFVDFRTWSAFTSEEAGDGIGLYDHRDQATVRHVEVNDADVIRVRRDVVRPSRMSVHAYICQDSTVDPARRLVSIQFT